MLMLGQSLVVVSYFLLAYIPYFVHGMNRPEALRADLEARDLFPNKWGLLLLAQRWAHLPWWMRVVLPVCAIGTEAFVIINSIDDGARVRGWVVG